MFSLFNNKLDNANNKYTFTFRRTIKNKKQTYIKI